MWIASFFEENGEPALGLSPIVNVRDISDGSLVVSSGLMIEKGDGFYAYDFVGYDETKDYLIRSDSVTISGTDRYMYASTGEYNELLNEIKSTADDIDIRVILIKKIQINRLELDDGDTGNWVLYDDDDVTPLLTFDVKDKNGDLILQQSNVPSKRSKGY
jgi:hypothetical protein